MSPQSSQGKSSRSSKGGKSFGASRDAGTIAHRLAQRRYGTPSTSDVPPDPAAPTKAPTTPPGRKEPKPAAVAGVLSRPATRMVTRSWYLPAEVAEELAATADRVAAGLPGVTKHQALAALLRAGIAQADQVRAELAAQLRGQLGL